MEKAKISAKQLFSLIVLFELGSAIVVGLGMKAKQDAWLAILLGMAGGLALFLVYIYLFRQYPDLPFTGYMEKILGKFIGRTLALIYILYFLYIASRVLRDFGELLLTSTLEETPLLVVNLMMLFIISYGCYLGIESLGRTGEIYLIITMALAFLGIFLVFASGVFKPENLLPVLENGWKPVLTTAFPQTLTFPFGEMIVFAMLLPYLNNPQSALKIGWSAMLFSGLLLTFIITINIGVLGAHIAANATFPLLKTFEKINVGDFIQRLDAIGISLLIIGGFFKVAVFFYAAVIGLADLFKAKSHRSLVYPAGAALLVLSLLIAGNFVQHIEIGLQMVPPYMHVPLQIVIPMLLAAVSWIKRELANN